MLDQQTSAFERIGDYDLGEGGEGEEEKEREKKREIKAVCYP